MLGIKLITLPASLLTAGIVYGMFTVLEDAIDVAGISRPEILSNGTYLRVAADEEFFSGLPSPPEKNPSFWYSCFLSGVGAWISVQVLSSATWLAVSAYNIPSWRAMTRTACTDWTIMVTYGVIWAVVSARSSIEVHDATFLGLYFATIPGIILWALTFRRIAARMVRFPVLFAMLLASCSLASALFILLVLFPSFAASGLAGRVAIRLLVLPVSTELFQAGVRALCSHWFRKALPTDVSVALLMPVTLMPALLGRFYTTTVESTAVSIGFAVAVSVVECVMRFTVPWRDKLYARWAAAAAGSLPASWRRWWAGLDERGLQWQAGEGKDSPVAAGSGASDSMRTRRMFFQFMLLDTACEDVAVMLNIPIAVWFRLPAVRGGAPIPLSSTIVRVVVQVVLEACTDLASFVGYAVLRSVPGRLTHYSGDAVPLIVAEGASIKAAGARVRGTWLAEDSSQLVSRVEPTSASGAQNPASDSSTGSPSDPTVFQPSLQTRASVAAPDPPELQQASGTPNPAATASASAAVLLHRNTAHAPETSQRMPAMLAFMLYSRLPPCCACCERHCLPPVRGAQADAFEAAVHEAHADSLAAELHPSWGHMDERAAYEAMQEARGRAVGQLGADGHALSAETESDAGGSRAAMPSPLGAKGKGAVVQQGGGAMIDDTPAGSTAMSASLTLPEQGAGSSIEPLPWLWRVTFFLERTAMRQALAWETRPRWWTAAFVLGTAATCTYLLRIAFGTFVLCPQYDADGERFYDYCLPQ